MFCGSDYLGVSLLVYLFFGGNVWVLTGLAYWVFWVITNVGTDKIIESFDTTAKRPDFAKSNVIFYLYVFV